MGSEVKDAPKAVIEELDNFDDGENFPSGLLTWIIDHEDSLENTTKWLYRSDNQREKEVAVVNHVFGNERLQPEREPRWTVEKEINGYTKSLVFESGETNFRSYTPNATYMFGLTEEQARGYAELFGGEPKEIK